MNVDGLLEIIYNSLPQLATFKIRLPMSEKTQSFVSWIYEKAHVSEISYGDFVTLSVECNAKMHDKIVSKCQSLNGLIIS